MNKAATASNYPVYDSVPLFIESTMGIFSPYAHYDDSSLWTYFYQLGATRGLGHWLTTIHKFTTTFRRGHMFFLYNYLFDEGTFKLLIFNSDASADVTPLGSIPVAAPSPPLGFLGQKRLWRITWHFGGKSEFISSEKIPSFDWIYMRRTAISVIPLFRPIFFLLSV